MKLFNAFSLVSLTLSVVMSDHVTFASDPAVLGGGGGEEVSELETVVESHDFDNADEKTLDSAEDNLDFSVFPVSITSVCEGADFDSVTKLEQIYAAQALSSSFIRVHSDSDGNTLLQVFPIRSWFTSQETADSWLGQIKRSFSSSYKAGYGCSLCTDDDMLDFASLGKSLLKETGSALHEAWESEFLYELKSGRFGKFDSLTSCKIDLVPANDDNPDSELEADAEAELEAELEADAEADESFELEAVESNDYDEEEKTIDATDGNLDFSVFPVSITTTCEGADFDSVTRLETLYNAQALAESFINVHSGRDGSVLLQVFTTRTWFSEPEVAEGGGFLRSSNSWLGQVRRSFSNSFKSGYGCTLCTDDDMLDLASLREVDSAMHEAWEAEFVDTLNRGRFRKFASLTSCTIDMVPDTSGPDSELEADSEAEAAVTTE